MIEQWLNEIEAVRPLKLPPMNEPVGPRKALEVVKVTREELDHRLTSFVRTQYLDYTAKVLKENFQSWLSSEIGFNSGLKILDEDIQKCAEEIELEAVKACMVVSLYRTAILESIENIQRETNENHLNTALIHTRLNQRKDFKDSATQTVERPPRVRKRKSSSLEEKMRNFEKTFCDEKAKTPNNAVVYQFPESLQYNSILSPPICTPLRPPATPTINIPPASVPPTPTPFLTPAQTPATGNMDEKILHELQQLFGDDAEQKKKNDEEEIFGDKEPIPDPPDIPSPELHPFETVEDIETKERAMTEKLKFSVWPCELHHQRQNLRAVLSEIAERNYRHYEKIKSRFEELFGDADDENVLAPYSPSIELDEVLIASCRHRISKWVVRALMKPLKEGMIGNKFLFKKLARRTAENIILVNQYPDERTVKDYIQDYFCRHKKIASLDDIY